MEIRKTGPYLLALLTRGVAGGLAEDADALTLPVPPNAPGDRVVSSMAIPAGATVSDQNTAISGILTRDTPDTVGTWYQAHLPPGWVKQAPPSEDGETYVLLRKDAMRP